jgi:hypothetical protein
MAPFYRREKRGRAASRGGGPAVCTGQGRARRLWRLAGVRGRPLWSGHACAGVLDRAEERQRDGGVRVVSPPFFHVSRPGSGLGHWGIDSGVRGDVLGYG